MKVLAIIVSYNFERWMDRCLNSLRQSEHPVDTLIIDNASQDRTVQRIKEEYPEIRLIESRTNLGFGRANNIGMNIALKEGYEAVLLINQDAWIDRDAIGYLAKLCLENPSYGIVSPVHLTGSGGKPDPGFGEYAHIADLDQLPQEAEIIELPFVNAAFWMIRTDVLRQTGGFCPLFYHYGEDKDFVNRLHYHRYRVGYVPKVFGNHDREYRPMTHEGFLRMEYVYHLSEYANINYSLGRAFGYGIVAVLKKCLIALFKGDFRLCKDYGVMMFRLMSRHAEVCSYRRTNRLSHPHYIKE